MLEDLLGDVSCLELTTATYQQTLVFTSLVWFPCLQKIFFFQNVAGAKCCVVILERLPVILQSSTGGFRLLQYFSVNVVSIPHRCLIIVLILDLLVFCDITWMRSNRGLCACKTGLRQYIIINWPFEVDAPVLVHHCACLMCPLQKLYRFFRVGVINALRCVTCSCIKIQFTLFTYSIRLAIALKYKSLKVVRYWSF